MPSSLFASVYCYSRERIKYVSPVSIPHLISYILLCNSPLLQIRTTTDLQYLTKLPVCYQGQMSLVVLKHQEKYVKLLLFANRHVHAYALMHKLWLVVKEGF